MRPGLELVSTGLELLTGRTVNTHAHTLARHLMGLRLLRDTTVPDDRRVIRQAIAEALSRVDVVVVSGGLGPTSDDVTRQAVGDLTGQGLVMHEPSRQAIRERYARTGRALNQMVENHALVLERAEVFLNPAGLAPGQHIAWGERHIFLLPGPPHEFEALLKGFVIPMLNGWTNVEPPEVRIFQVCGLGESDLVSRLGGADFPGPDLEVAYCASIGRVEVRVWGSPRQRAALDRATDRIRSAAGLHLYSERSATLEEVVGEKLLAAQATLATAESCTGGLLAHRLTSVPGSSAWFLGGTIAYANEVKVRELGVCPQDLQREGAVSEVVARQMAEGVRRTFGSAYGIGVTGIAGPGGGTEQKPVGLVYVAVVGPAGMQVREHRFAGARAVVKESSATMAMDLLRRMLP